ncbi:MAG: argininosuccinate lyase [Aggregatilineales bacterium]
MRLWGGRFSEPSAAELRALNDSLSFDQRLALHDIAGSLAYARALAAAGVLQAREAETIISGLEQVRAEFEAGVFQFGPFDEDIHTAVERRLTELVGPVGGKLHTGRSRNDQVATDVRLWTREALAVIDGLLASVQWALLQRAREHLETLMPGYTHFQPAQPITAGHWLLSFFWMFARDRERLIDCQRRVNVSPLGSGALAGTPFAVDRAALAEALGFASHSHNSLDAVSDRDFVAETLFVFALIGVHLSRLAEDIILYSNPSLGFVMLDERYSTGSSLMPQKRNADPMELTRGKAGRLLGNLAGLLATLKGLPSAYNKDLQEDKEPLFDSFDALQRLLPVVAAVIASLRFNSDRMRSALTADMLATDLADYLVKRDIPFREAHHIVGEAVRLAAEQGVTLNELPLTTLRKLSKLFDEDVQSVFDFHASVRRRTADGGTAPEAVQRQIDEAEALMAKLAIYWT